MVLHEGGNYQEMISGASDPPQQPIASATTPTQAAPKPGWVHKHPFLATTIGIGGLLILGVALVIQRGDINPSNTSGAWGGAGGIFFGNARNAAPTGPDVNDVVRLQSPQGSYAPIPIFTPSEETPDGTTGDDGITALLGLLVQKIPAGSASVDTTAPDSYSFIPQGFISAEPSTRKRNAMQEKLFTYGNAVGTQIKGYEDTHRGTAQILRDHVEDRKNPDKIRAVKLIGTDMQQLGVDLRNLSGIPTEATAMHKEYGNAYIVAGGNLLKVADTTTDEEFVSAITAYNTSVEKLTKQFLLLVTLFGTNEVTFSASDQGNVFMFSPNLSLTQ